MTVSIVIPHWNRRNLVLSLLESIRRQELPDDVEVEVVVVDNGSTDGSAAAAEAAGARVLRMSGNEGVSRALNRGIAESSGEIVALLNNDIELAPQWLAHLLRAVARGGVWFATGKTLDYEKHSQIDGTGDAVCRGGTSWRLGHGKDDGPLFARPRRTYFPSATATVFRRSFFDRVGLLEESFFAYLEDVDLGLRAAMEDLPGVYVPEAVAYHRGGATSGGAWNHRMVEWMSCHQVLLLAKFYSAAMLMRFSREILAAQFLWAALAISRGCGLAWLRGVTQGFWRFGQVRRAAARIRGKDERLREILSQSEGDIARVQRATSWDAYWQWYFRLAGTSSEACA